MSVSNQSFFGLTAAASVFIAGSASAQESFTTLFGVVPNPGLPTVLAGPGELSSGVGEFPDAEVLNGLEAFTNFNVQNLAEDLLGGGANEGQVIFLQNANFYVGGGQLFPGAPLGPEPPAALGPAPAGPIAQQAISEQGQINLAGLGIVDTAPDIEGLQTFNNRAFGVFGPGRSDITFDFDESTGFGVTEVILQAGITIDEFSIGANPAFGQSLPEGSPLADGDGTILIYTESGLQATISLADALGVGLDAASPDNGLINQDLAFSVSDFGAGNFITRISIINESTALNSATFLTELTATTVPEPSSLALLGLGGLAVMRRRK